MNYYVVALNVLAAFLFAYPILSAQYGYGQLLYVVAALALVVAAHIIKDQQTKLNEWDEKMKDVDTLHVYRGSNQADD